MTEDELDALGWAEYGSERYWQRDDGEVAILLTPMGYNVHLVHRRYRRYAREEIATGVATLREAIELTVSIPGDQVLAERHRAYLTRSRARRREAMGYLNRP